MTPVDFSKMECSIARALDAIGDRWSLLILRDAFYGIRRFEDFREDLGVARNILADRLQKLVAHGVLDRVPYDDKPPRFEYRLTDKGRELLPVILTMMKWGNKWTHESEHAPVTLTHTRCGHASEPLVMCSHCGEELLRKEVRVDPLPDIVMRRALANSSSS